MANEKRLIDVNDFIAKYCASCGGGCDLEYERCATVIDLMKAPAVDAAPVVHGRWEDFCGDKMCCCSVCKAEFDNTCNDIHGEWYFCPNCSADMRGDVNG